MLKSTGASDFHSYLRVSPLPILVHSSCTWPGWIVVLKVWVDAAMAGGTIAAAKSRGAMRFMKGSSKTLESEQGAAVHASIPSMNRGRGYFSWFHSTPRAVGRI